MNKYDKKPISFVLAILMVLGIIVFATFGGTFAYFQINNKVEAQYELAKVDAYWFNGVEEIPGGTVNLTTAGTEIIRGDNKGANISVLVTAGSSAGTGLYLNTASGSAEQYVRIKYNTSIVDSQNSNEIEDENLKEHLKFRIVDAEGNVTSILGEGASYWKEGEDGWLYYKHGGAVAGTSIDVTNNIFMATTFPPEYLGQQLKITFTFETIQEANNAVDLWGDSAKTALGLN